VVVCFTLGYYYLMLFISGVTFMSLITECASEFYLFRNIESCYVSCIYSSNFMSRILLLCHVFQRQFPLPSVYVCAIVMEIRHVLAICLFYFINYQNYIIWCLNSNTLQISISSGRSKILLGNSHSYIFSIKQSIYFFQKSNFCYFCLSKQLDMLFDIRSAFIMIC